MLHLAYVLGKFYLTSLWGSCLICKMSIKLVSISGLWQSKWNHACLHPTWHTSLWRNGGHHWQGFLLRYHIFQIPYNYSLSSKTNKHNYLKLTRGGHALFLGDLESIPRNAVEGFLPAPPQLSSAQLDSQWSENTAGCLCTEGPWKLYLQRTFCPRAPASPSPQQLRSEHTRETASTHPAPQLLGHGAQSQLGCNSICHRSLPYGAASDFWTQKLSW